MGDRPEARLHGQHRRLDPAVRRARSRRAAPARRRGSLRGEAARTQPLRGLRRAARRGIGAQGGAEAGTSRCRRARRDVSPLPADPRPRVAAPGRRRGPAALDAPRAGPRAAAGFHPPRRGVRPDRADRRMGAARGSPPAEALARGGPRPAAARSTCRVTSSAKSTSSRRTTALLSRFEVDRACSSSTSPTFLRDGDGGARALRELRAIGVRLSLDDFGTGRGAGRPDAPRSTP